jgi:CDGSH-type Zn-finger protein/ferredoxin
MMPPPIMPEPKGTITIRPDGPYRIEGEIPLEDADGRAFESKPAYSLCRCGHSANKPYCDATHKTIGFQGKETADPGPIANRRVAYRAEGVTIYDDRSVCSHSGRCTNGLPSVFRMRQKPWIEPTGAPAEEIAAAVRKCPSGALAYSLGSFPEPVEEERPAAIRMIRDGPYAVVGAPMLTFSDGTVCESRARYTLCRCGGSKNKPFCDGTHSRIGFKNG